MNDFIFGSLATDDLRRARALSLKAGVVHNFRRTPFDPQPYQPIEIELSSGPAHPGERAWVYWTVDGSDPAGLSGKCTNGFVLSLKVTDTVWDVELWGYISHYKASLPGLPNGTLVRYRLSLEVFGEGEVFADGGAYHAFYVDDDHLPEWTQDAQVYHIFVDRFNPGQGHDWKTPGNLLGFYGGRIEGITEKLDYIKELGFNTLWLSPIFPSPSHHGYDATDLFEIEPRMGTKADLRCLLDEAHHRGMRILLDFVINHWSNLHPTFQDAILHPKSHYRDWYTFKRYPDDYEAFFGVKELPQVNLRNPAARQHMLDAVKYWLEFGVDGYRLDYAIGPTPDFWADFRQVTRAAKPDCWTFGEIVDPPDVQKYFAGVLDGSLDFVLLEALRQTLAFGRWTGDQLAGFLVKHEAYFPEGFSRLSFLDNHDMNRFLWAVKGDTRRLKLAALCQFTLSGPPIVYYGTEVGLSQQRDVRQENFGKPEEARQPMIWDAQYQNQGLVDYYRKLSTLRQSITCLRRGAFSVISSSKDTLVYTRQEGGQRCVVVLNLSDREQLMPLPEGCSRLLLASEDGCKIKMIETQASFTLPALAGAVFA